MNLLQLNIEYPELPVVSHRKEFFELLKTHNVVIVKADTGSGKSTQLPKFLLEYFIAENSKLNENEQKKFKIGVTEPRRLAAISIADRLREELKDDTLVSTKIRFWEQGEANAPIKVMTDGILLQEFRKDKFFKQYSAIIIDEAHERSLNIDILLGILKNVLKTRTDFKLIIASATLDATLFEKFYDNSCVLEAEGRTFPVTVKYYFDESNDLLRDTSGKGDSGLLDEACNAIVDLESQCRDNLLCFLPTERDIQDLALQLEHELNVSTFEVLPLFGRMNPDEQRKIFKSTNKTRIVLATNIAETSLTIPGIAYVVDSGSARISRYNAQSRIQGLPIEEISKASARQRTGRAGRVKPGVCVRLYSPENFEARDEFTEPEIRRSNLANVVLQLRSLGLSMEHFPFLQPPPQSAFRGAYKTLYELGALTIDNSLGRVTEFGFGMIKLPMDVSLSAVLLHAKENGVLQAALIVCSALSVQDMRIVPADEPERTRVRQLHKKFAGHKSDFLTFICIWNAFNTDWDNKSWNKLRKFCDKFSLHFLRCREWVDLYTQFSRIIDAKFESRVCPLENFHADNLHISLLSGFLGGIAHRDIENGCYRLVNGRETYVFPGSDICGKNVDWLFSTEVRETSRIFLNKSAEIKPEWIESVASKFCTRRWYMPTWNKDRGFVEAIEEVSFRGLVISRGRRIDYAHVNPKECAEIFWREAIVLAQIARPFDFMVHNEHVLESLHAIEARKRKYGLAPSEDALVDYYERIAPSVNSIKTLKKYIIEHTDQFLKFDEAFWISEANVGESFIDSGFSNRIEFSNKVALDKKNALHDGSIEQFRIEIFEDIYKDFCNSNRFFIVNGEMVFNATSNNDGITLNLPCELLSFITPSILAFSIKQWREWIIEAIIREMPNAAKKFLIDKRSFIDDDFCDALKSNPYKSPLLIAYEIFANNKHLNCEIPTVSPEKETHLRLHINIINASLNFHFEMSPEWGSFNLLCELQKVIESVGAYFTLPKIRFGSRMGNFVLMSNAESYFWKSFNERLSNAHKNISDIADRLNLLELGGLYANGFESAKKEFAQKSLIADNLNASCCVRFSGLEFSRGKKLSDFKNLAASTRKEDDNIRIALVRATYESSLIGANAFIAYWIVLRKFSVYMRQANEISYENMSVVKKIVKIYAQENSLFVRLCELANVAINEFGSEFNANKILKFIAALPPQKIELNLDTKLLREKFRTFLKSGLLKDTELAIMRELLTKIESTKIGSCDFSELFVRINSMFENFEILKFKRKRFATEEIVEESSLAKLKSTFGKL